MCFSQAIVTEGVIFMLHVKEIHLINDAFQLVANKDELDCFNKHKTNLCNLEKHYHVC